LLTLLINIQHSAPTQAPALELKLFIVADSVIIVVAAKQIRTTANCHRHQHEKKHVDKKFRETNASTFEKVSTIQLFISFQRSCKKKDFVKKDIADVK
jgi:hypothetical protein